MNKDERNELLRTLIVIDRQYSEGKFDKAHENTLRVIMRLITKVYDISTKD